MKPLHLIDFYKSGHYRQYPKGTEQVVSNWTARSSRMPGVDKVVLFGLQYFVKKYLIEAWNKEFFNKDIEEVLEVYMRRMDNALGKGSVTPDHIRALHDLGFLPLTIKALPEGSLVPLRIPSVLIYNTKEYREFYWLTNYIETIFSTTLWLPCTSATTAYQYRKLLNEYALKTVGNTDFVSWQGHDFSMRGMAGLEAAQLSGAAHLLSFTGTDTVPAIDFLEEYYGANSDKELIGGSVAATEHSVMTMGREEGEFDIFKDLIKNVYPSGIISIVSDSFDFWKVITEYLPTLKDVIMLREGKVVIRPDSGDPVDIICGTHSHISPMMKLYGHESTPQTKGLIECLWDIFGGTISEKGYKILDSHIGAIYGDSITLDRARQICERLEAKGFASTNIVLGIGSYTYNYVTRDVFGFAVKATAGRVNSKDVEIFKDPKTDNSGKKSAKGLLAVYRQDNTFILKEQATWDEVNNCAFETVFEDGALMREQTLAEIRQILQTS